MLLQKSPELMNVLFMLPGLGTEELRLNFSADMVPLQCVARQEPSLLPRMLRSLSPAPAAASALPLWSLPGSSQSQTSQLQEEGEEPLWEVPSSITKWQHKRRKCPAANPTLGRAQGLWGFLDFYLGFATSEGVQPPRCRAGFVMVSPTTHLENQFPFPRVLL